MRLAFLAATAALTLAGLAAGVACSKDYGTTDGSDASSTVDAASLATDDGSTDAGAAPADASVDAATCTEPVDEPFAAGVGAWTQILSPAANGNALTVDNGALHVTALSTPTTAAHVALQRVFSGASFRTATLAYDFAAKNVDGYAEVGCALDYLSAPSSKEEIVAELRRNEGTGAVSTPIYGALVDIVDAGVSSVTLAANLTDSAVHHVSVVLAVDGRNVTATFVVDGQPGSQPISLVSGSPLTGLAVECGVIYLNTTTTGSHSVDIEIDNVKLTTCN